MQFIWIKLQSVSQVNKFSLFVLLRDTERTLQQIVIGEKSKFENIVCELPSYQTNNITQDILYSLYPYSTNQVRCFITKVNTKAKTVTLT